MDTVFTIARARVGSSLRALSCGGGGGPREDIEDYYPGAEVYRVVRGAVSRPGVAIFSRACESLDRATAFNYYSVHTGGQTLEKETKFEM